MQRKNACRKKYLNAKLIKLSFLCHGKVIHLTLVVLSSTELETIVTQKEMKRKNAERILCCWDNLILDKYKMKCRNVVLKKLKNSWQKRFVSSHVHTLWNKKVGYVLFSQRLNSHILIFKYCLLLNMSWM